MTLQQETQSSRAATGLATSLLHLGNASRSLLHGICPSVGIGGHASHDGFGFTFAHVESNSHTLTTVNTVLANGTIIIVCMTIQIYSGACEALPSVSDDLPIRLGS